MSNGLDHYDEAVLTAIDPENPPSRVKTVDMYRTHTRITSRVTAKKRAKLLWSREDFPGVAGDYE